MSNPSASPARDESFSPLTELDSSTFYSFNESGFDSSLLLDANRTANSDDTLTTIGQTTLDFILDEKQQIQKQQPKAAVQPSAIQTPKPTAEPIAPVVPTATVPAALIPTTVPMGDRASATPSPKAGSAEPTAVATAALNGGAGDFASPSVDANKQPPPTVIAIPDDTDSVPSDSTIIELSSDDDDIESESASLAEVDIKIYDTLAEFEANLPSTVKILHGKDGARVYVVGTAHFSRESMNDVSLVIRNARPNIVMIELCQSRLHILRQDEKTVLEEAENFTVAKFRHVIQQSGLFNGLVYIALLKMSARLTKELGMAPGSEFRRALEEVCRLEHHCTLHLGDRPIQITVQRALGGLSAWQTVKILWKLFTEDEKISKEDVEKCKQADMLEKLMNEMAGEYPEFRDVFVSERDLYLCHSLEIATAHVPDDIAGSAIPTAVALPERATEAGSLLPSSRPNVVVGVVGIGHLAGIAKHWGNVDVSRLPEITSIPEPSRRSRVVRFAFKWSLVSVMWYGVYRIVRPFVPKRWW